MTTLFRIRNRIALVLLGTFALLWILLLPGGDYVNVYRSVHDPRGESSDILYLQQPARGGKPQYVIQDSRLYLETHRIREGWLADWVNYTVRTQWTEDDIAALRRNRPGLEPLWPDSSTRSGGVAWVGE